jgi:hypothetical protein
MGRVTLGESPTGTEFNPQISACGFLWAAIQCVPVPTEEFMENERRRSPRFTFIAQAEVQDETSGSRLPSRISDLSLSGCYVDIINPFPDGTPVRVKIYTTTQNFEASATVAYAHAHLGMGLSFREVKPESLAVLQNWLPAEAAANP